MTRLTVAVFLGGRSDERRVSFVSGRAVARALAALGHRVLTFDPAAPHFARAFLKAAHRLDAVFVALHGPQGEDGTIQGWLDTTGVPYTGCGVLASALAMHKPSAKRAFEGHCLPTPSWLLVRDKDAPTARHSAILKGFPLPVVVKPASQGSAIGVTIVRRRPELSGALRLGFRFDHEVIVERYIEGREITVGVLGDTALPVIEVVVNRPYPFYTYKARYTPGATRHEVPATLSWDMTRRVQGLALAAHRALGCRGATRVDFMMTRRDDVFVLEVNTIPGLTPTSLLPDAARAIGMSFEDLIHWMIQDARRHHGIS